MGDFNAKLREIRARQLEAERGLGDVPASDELVPEPDIEMMRGQSTGRVSAAHANEANAPADWEGPLREAFRPDAVIAARGLSEADGSAPTAGITARDGDEDDSEASDDARDLAPRYPRFEFITGAAGTGKTWIVRKRAEEDDGVVLCATTGIASVNLGEGTTINAFLKYFDTASLRDAFTEGWLELQLMKHARSGVRQITLDEVSMLDGEQLTIFCLALDSVNEKLENAGEPGLGLTLTGDFCQLPPVKAKFAFEVEEWKRFEEHTTRLTKIWRQDDAPFIEALQAARRGHGRTAVEFFAKFLTDQTDHDYDGSTILAKNEHVDNYNRLRQSKLPGKWAQWKATRWGEQRTDWKNVPDLLDLKEGALVMILANKRKRDPYTGLPLDELEYANGELAELVEQVGASAVVRLRRTEKNVTVDPITRQWLKPFEVGRKKELKEQHGANWKQFCSEDGKREVVGAITYQPLRVAYATTVHKSQGLTLDNVQINLRDNFFKTPGMLYVALSRCRTAEGLRIVGNSNSFVERCTIDRRVLPWL